ncbi:MAG: aminotransferase class III-fold pyridoxal phosphate-dependent enzyme [Limnobacter sp.]|nr:aminotransferase class III-fold pyridoxal phosphate-dependent enzyme [Limnobacter sp.]
MEKLALIGIGCRLPAGIATPGDLWRFLQAGQDAVEPVPQTRWNHAAFFSQDMDEPGKTYCGHGAFLNKVYDFDPAFFNLSRREAERLDPQQKLLLETAWHALEDANLAASHLKNSRTGIFVGLGSDDWRDLSLSNTHQYDAYSGLGSSRSAAAGRLAFLLDTHGPALQIDTSCSSGLSAAHLACQSLLTGESDLALVGAVNLMLTPASYVLRARLKALSPTGQCRSFDAAANGFVPGEGAGFLILKRLEDALKDRNTIYCSICSSAMRHDGASNGLTAPNQLEQEKTIRDALQKAGLDPSDIDYIETHGTGTPLGDPVEVAALKQVFGQRENDLLIGSVKTNFGHLEAAAGLLSMMKTALMLKHNTLAPQLHFSQPNPHIDWAGIPIKVCHKKQSWPNRNQPNRAGVSAFGMSGTNVHLIMEEHTSLTSTNQKNFQCTYPLLTLSAPSTKNLNALIEHWLVFLNEKQDVNWSDICYSATVGRNQFRHRCVLLAESAKDAKQKLLDMKNLQASAKEKTGPLAFVFLEPQNNDFLQAGPQMSREEAFALTLQEIDKNLEHLKRPPIGQHIRAGIGSTDDLLLTQLARFAFQLALARFWQSLNVHAEVILGQGSGEIAAAVASKALCLRSALALIAEYATWLKTQAHESHRTSKETGSQAENHSSQNAQQQAANLQQHFENSGLCLTGARPESELISAENGRFEYTNCYKLSYWAWQLTHTTALEKAVSELEKTDINHAIEMGTGHGMRMHASLSQSKAAVSYNTFASLWQAGCDVALEKLADCQGQSVSIPLSPFLSELCVAKDIQHVLQNLMQGIAQPTSTDMHKGPAMMNNPHSLPNSTETKTSSALPAYVEMLRENLSQLLKIDVHAIDPEHTLLELGADSLILTEVIRSVEKEWDVRLSVRQLFEDLLSVESLALYICQARGGESTRKILTQHSNAAQPIQAQPIQAQPIQAQPSHAMPTKIKFNNQAECLQHIVQQATTKTPQSAAYASHYSEVLCDARRVFSAYREELGPLRYSIAAHRSQGSHFWDVDGNHYVDLAMGFGSHLFGHRPDFLMDALYQQLDLGIHLGPVCHLAGEVAEMISQLTGTDRVTFCNSGTEAVMTAIRIARAATGRSKIALMKNAYHGHFDGTLVTPDMNSPDHAAKPMSLGRSRQHDQ